MPQNSTFISEAKDAFRGILALLMGDTAAPRYFDFSPAGIASSFVPVLVIMGVELILQAVTGVMLAGEIWRAALRTVLVYCGSIGSITVLLSLFGRRDALGPFVVTYNWTNAALPLVLLPLSVIGVLPALLITAVIAIVLMVNVGRLVMTLKPGQIAMLVVVPLFVGMIALIVSMSLLPLPAGAVPTP